MPDPVKTEKTEPQVEILPPEPEKQIVVEPEAQKTEPKVVPEDLEKIHKRMEYQTRQVEKALRQMSELTQRFQTIQPSQPSAGETPSQPLDEIDQIAEKDWKLAVTKLGRKAAEELLLELSAKQQADQNLQRTTQQLESSKSKVLKKYPSISDETSEEAKVYMEVMNEDPEILKNPMGPEIAMYRMEERLNLKRPEINQEVDKEVQRRARIGAASVPQGRGAGSEDRIILTADEKEFCDRLNIPYASYHKTRKLGEAGKFKEGVTHDGKE